MGNKENKELIAKILGCNGFFTEYQPIVHLATQTIYAYEALGRFAINGVSYSPLDVFSYAHKSPMLYFELEQRLKFHQLSNRPTSGLLFVNIDPHNFNSIAKLAIWRDTFYGIKNICVEITENTDLMSIALVQKCADELKLCGVEIAQDDIGADGKPFCFELLCTSDYLKFDLSWITKIRADKNLIHVLDGFLTFARKSNKLTILEGIETEQDLKLAQKLNVDFIQGFYYKDKFIVAKNQDEEPPCL